VGDIDLKVISTAENSNSFPKNQVLEGKINQGRGNIWANGTGHTRDEMNFTSLHSILALVSYISLMHVFMKRNKAYSWFFQSTSYGSGTPLLSSNQFQLHLTLQHWCCNARFRCLI
jgi:hypothetical protein